MDKSKQKKIQCDKNKVQNSKNKNWQAKPNRSKGISFSESNKLLYDIENSKITYEEALERIRNIRRDINKIISMQLKPD